ncbi:hypothetical protein QCI77_21680 [Bacillus cereus group sp. MG9]|uniref:hypothetical protein n=1 Tax=Bacillus cereus group sp. MG9 TaxID=3040247 RepID=UPI003399B120
MAATFNAGKSYRATRQVNSWNNNAKNLHFESRIVKKNMTRNKALKWEQGHVNRISKAKGKFNPKYHKRPQPWW